MLSEKTWRPEAAARVFFGVITTLCVGLLFTEMATRYVPGLSPEQRKFLSMVLIGLFFQVAVMLWVASFLRGEGLTWNEAFGFSNPDLNRAIGLGLLAGIIVLPLAWGLQQLSATVMTWFQIKPVPQVVIEHLQKPAVPLGQKIYFGVLAVFIAPFAEELLFRGVLYPTIKQIGYPKVALWGTAILFSLSHLSAVTFVPLVLLAIVLALIYEETDNLLAPIVAHSTFNAANFLVLTLEEPLRKLFHSS